MNWEVIKQKYKQTKALENNIKQSCFFFAEEWQLVKRVQMCL